MSKRNQRLLLVALIALIGAFTSFQNKHESKDPAPKDVTGISSTEFYPVSKVVDGDTIDVDVHGKIVRVRLIGLDTPETVDPRQTVQCFGKEASEEMKKIAGGSSVRLEPDTSQSLYDQYGRYLAYVYVVANSQPAGILLNHYMIWNGFGHQYTYSAPYAQQGNFMAAERSAREAGRGLWAPGVCES